MPQLYKQDCADRQEFVADGKNYLRIKFLLLNARLTQVTRTLTIAVVRGGRLITLTIAQLCPNPLSRFRPDHQGKRHLNILVWDWLSSLTLSRDAIGKHWRQQRCWRPDQRSPIRGRNLRSQHALPFTIDNGPPENLARVVVAASVVVTVGISLEADVRKGRLFIPSASHQPITPTWPCRQRKAWIDLPQNDTFCLLCPPQHLAMILLTEPLRLQSPSRPLHAINGRGLPWLASFMEKNMSSNNFT